MNITQQIASHYGLGPLVSRILVQRGYDTIDKVGEYLGYTVPTFDPMEVHGVPEAAQRIRWALENGERILVYGDYDVDGITGAAVMYSYLSQYSRDRKVIDFYVPDRIKDGYGLTERGVRKLYDQGFDGLVVTVDNGIAAHAAVDLAHGLGQFQVLITDHHTVPRQGPPNTWVVNPRIGDQFPIMSGVAVAHMICCALEMQRETEKGVDWLMDLVAIGTVADMCSLTGINRSLVRFGLDMMNSEPRLGIFELLRAVNFDMDNEPITTETIGFKIAPCLNAAGRIENPTDCVELLITDDPHRAWEIANWLIQVNEERKVKSGDSVAKADQIAQEKLQEDPGTKVLIVPSPDFHVGVVGLAAANVVQKYDMPVLMLTETEDGMLKGSARSVDGFSILDALTTCHDLMENYGGHAAAAGMSFKRENLPEVQRRLNEFAAQLVRPEVKRHPFDAEVKLAQITADLVRKLEIFEPCGQGNPAVYLRTAELNVLSDKLVGKKSADHLKAEFEQDGKKIDGIGFFMKESYPLPKDRPVTVTYKPSLNFFGGRLSVQMMLKEIVW